MSAIPSPLLTQGLQLLEAGQRGAAIATLQRAAEHAPKHPQAHHLLAELALADGQVAKALSHAVDGLKWERVRPEPVALAGWLLHLDGDSALGCRVLARVAPQLPQAAAWLAEARRSPRATREHPDLEALGRAPTISLCMIVKNETAFLARCLEAAKPHVDEIVVVDTGSTDDTVAIARSFGARVEHFTWCDDFAAARNFSLEAATGDWAFTLDADEVFEAAPGELRRLLDFLPWPEQTGLAPCVGISRLAHDGPVRNPHAPATMLPRFFPRALLRWEHVVHETPTVVAPGYAISSVAGARMLIHHEGHATALMQARGKNDRNVRLLAKRVEVNPEDASAYYYLGEEHMLAGEDEAACAAFARAEALGDDQQVPLAVYQNWSYCACRANQPQAALDALERGFRREPDFPVLWCMAGQALELLGRTEEAIARYQGALDRHDYNARRGVMGIRWAQPAHTEAIPREALKRLKNENKPPEGLVAAMKLRREGDRAGARRALEDAVALAPRHTQAHHLLAELALDEGDVPRALAHAVDGLTWERSRPEPLALAGRLLHLDGDSALGIRLLERVADQHAPAAAWLAEARQAPNATREHPELACLAERARISLCMIVKDEAQFLGRCLEAAKPHVDEIVVVDTGSTDGTVAIAEAAGARIGHFPWREDFAAARNHAVELATGDWVLVLDADEVIEAEVGALRRLIDVVPMPQLAGLAPVGLLAIQDRRGRPLGEDTQRDSVPRFFTRAHTRYRGRVHEQPARLLDPDRFELHHFAVGDVVVHHYGYRPEVVAERNKVQRYLELLRADAADNPDDLAALSFLAREASFAGAYEESVKAAADCWRLWPEARREQFPRRTFFHQAASLVALGRVDEAREVMDRALALDPAYPSYHFLLGELDEKGGDWEGAIAHYQAAIADADYHARFPLQGYNAIAPEHAGAMPRSGILRCERALGRAIEPTGAKPPSALERALACLVNGELEAAEAALVEVEQQEPHHTQVPFLRAELAFRRDDFDAALALALRSVQASPGRPEPWALAAVVLYERGDSATALRFAARAQGVAPGYEPAKRLVERARRTPRATATHPELAQV